MRPAAEAHARASSGVLRVVDADAATLIALLTRPRIPAPAGSLLAPPDAHCASGGKPSPLPVMAYKRLAALVMNGAWAAVDADEAPVAIGGLYAYPDGSAREAWLRTLPDVRARLAPLLRLCRRQLAAAGAGAPIVARTAPGNRAGERLVTLIGFAPAGVMTEGANVWRWP